MEAIFFVYGLAFFLMGFAVLNYPKKGSSFFLAKKIHFVAWFGIIHGLNEWLDMFIMIDVMELSLFLKMVRMFTLPLSFLCLIYFGAEVISSQKSNCRFCKILTPGLLAVWAVIFLLGEPSDLRWDIWSRYILCLTGGTLTGIALLMHIPELSDTDNSKLIVNLKVAGSAFIAYGFLAGAIVREGEFFPATILNYSLFKNGMGIPVQVFRSLCAVVIAYHLIHVLKIFQWETQQSLFKCEYRFKAVVDTVPVILFMTDPDLNVTFIEGQGMKSMPIESSHVIGKPVTEVFPDSPLILENAQKASAGEELTVTVSLEDSYWEVFLGPLKNTRGKIEGVTGVAVDVTLQKTAQAQRDNYRYDMEKNKTLAAIGALSAEIANDMAAPLQESKISFLSASNGLRKTIGAEEVKENIKNGLNGLTKTINKLSVFCEKANLKKPFEAQPIEIHQIVERLLSVFRETAQQAMMKISIEGSDLLPVMLISSRELEQVLYTMLQQLIRACDGEHVCNLDIKFLAEKSFLLIKFSEYCSGQPLSIGQTIFTSASNGLSGEDTYNFELSVLKGIIEAYSGTINIAPNARGGLVYEIRIPVAA
jgi:PAS domain-containing protein